MAWLITIGLIACTLAYDVGVARYRIEAYFLPKEWLLHATALAALIILAARRARLAFDAIDICLAGFVVVGLVSGCLAFNPWLAARAEAMALSATIIFLCCRRLARDGAGVRLRGAASVAILILTATVLCEAFVPGVLVALPRALPGGVAGHRNHMAHALAIGAPCLLWSARRARPRALAILFFVGVAGTSAALVLSRCRAAWLACFAALAIAIVLGGVARMRILERRTLSLAAAAAIGIIIALVAPNRLRWSAAHPYEDSLKHLVDADSPSGRGRLIQDRTLLAVAVDHPIFGVGPGNWIVHYPEHAPPHDPNLNPPPFVALPRTTWFAWIAEWGLAGCALLLLAAALAARWWWRRLRAPAEPDRGAPLVGFVTLVAAIVAGTFDAVLQPPLTAFLFFVIAGACSPAERVVPRPALSSRAHTWIHACAALAVCGALVHTSVQLYADRITQGCGMAELERASRIYPGSTFMHRLLARNHAAANQCAAARREVELALALEPRAADMQEVLRACAAYVLLERRQ